jgi:hypothetical protein
MTAATGHDAPPRRMQLFDFKPLRKGSLRGFATVRLPNGLTITDYAVCTNHGRTLASLPGKAILDADRWHTFNDAGMRRYVPILSWANRATTDGWLAAILDLFREAHPGALDNRGGA